jgi:hypothetical protein
MSEFIFAMISAGSRGGLGQKRTVDQERWQQRFGIDDWQSKTIHEAVIVEALDLVAKSQKGIARNRVNAAAVFMFLQLGGCQSDVTTDRHHLRDAIEWYFYSNFFDHGGDGAL